MDTSTVWAEREGSASAAAEIATALNLSPLTARLLVNRGIATPESAHTFLHPHMGDLHDPYTLPDMAKAVGRIAQAIDRGETIFLHGDYDADGVTSTALGYRALTTLGANVIPHVPKRSDGYDLQIAGVEKAHEKGASLIITADCGTRAIAAVARANELGMEVIITDHHRPGPELPPALAIVNPYRENFDVPFRALCGAGVLFKVMDALVMARTPSQRASFRQKYLDLVALGTVADMTPLVGENRILVTYGLPALRDTVKKGLRTLIHSLNLGGQDITAHHIGWTIAPSLNAAGRMEDADIAFRLLVARSDDEAEQLTAQMAALRENSRVESARVTLEALQAAMKDEQQGRRVLVIADDFRGKGVLGLAAGRIVEACRRPVVLLSYSAELDMYVGSARTRGNFALHTALEGCSDLLARYGGHSQSAGVSVTAANLEAFRDRINELAVDDVPEEPEPPTITYDAEITDGNLLNLSSLQEFGQLEPFGGSNEEPIFVSHRAEVVSARRCGKGDETLQLQVYLPGMSSPTKCVWFRNGEWQERLNIGDEIDIAYTPKINEWKGRYSVEMHLKDIKPLVPYVAEIK